VLALPGAAALALLLWLRLRVPNPDAYEPDAYEPDGARGDDSAGDRPERNPFALPRKFWLYCGFTAITMTGFATFGLLSFHMVTHRLLTDAAVPVVYAAAMGAGALAALASGWSYDRLGAKTLAALPVLSIAIVLLAFTNNVAMVVAGALLWGAATGIQESTLRAVVADVIAPPRRATAYGVFAAALGAATAAGGALIGWLYDMSPGSTAPLVVVVVAIQLVAMASMFAIRLQRVGLR
jgi:predicted MFS family arabinose efflux permease